MNLRISQNAILLDASKPGKLKSRKKKTKHDRTHSEQSSILHKEKA